MSTHPAAAFPARLSSQQDGYVVAVRGAIVDVRLSGDALHAVGDALLVMPGDLAPVLAEVQAHLGETTVRAVALQTTAGLRRGTLRGQR
jgi:F-type H+-transporting ATPase subunit beta